jgi:5-methylcytosine-specific restriction endonuclease McrA
MLWLKSRERSAALKRDNYQCSDCHIKQSKKKGYHVHMEVDHLRGTVDMDKLIDLVFKHLLVPMSDLETVCNLCHRKRTAFRAQIGESATL